MTLPCDPYAERAVIGVLLLSVHGLGFVAGIVTADDFHDRSLGRLFHAVEHLIDIRGLNVRAAAAATFTDLPFMFVDELTHEAPTQWDAGPWARRVSDSARRRRRAIELELELRTLVS